MGLAFFKACIILEIELYDGHGVEVNSWCFLEVTLITGIFLHENLFWEFLHENKLSAFLEIKLITGIFA